MIPQPCPVGSRKHTPSDTTVRFNSFKRSESKSWNWRVVIHYMLGEAQLYQAHRIHCILPVTIYSFLHFCEVSSVYHLGYHYFEQPLHIANQAIWLGRHPANWVYDLFLWKFPSDDVCIGVEKGVIY